MKNVVTYTEPKLMPLPTSITDESVRSAILPVKIEAARRAIAECNDLPELLRYRDQVEGMSAAINVMKHVAPEIVASVNLMCKEAFLKLGDLLLEFRGRPVGCGRSRQNKGPTPRTEVLEKLNIPRHIANTATRFAGAAPEIRSAILEDDSIKSNPTAIRSAVPASQKGRAPSSFAYSALMHGEDKSRGGLRRVLEILEATDLQQFRSGIFVMDEKKRIRKTLTAISDLVDEMDRLLK